MPVEKALVVDDSKSARIMLSRMIQKLGLEVDMVESGEEALAFMESNPYPDVIFMDHMMPGMDGLQTTQSLTTNASTKHIPIFMYTSKEGPEYEAELTACGAYGMLGKPAKPDRLRAIIAELNDQMAVAEATSDTSEISVTPAHEAPDAVTEQTPVKQQQSEVTFVEAEATPPEEEEMSKELIEEVSSVIVSRAIEDAMQPLTVSMHKLETSIGENQSEIRKLSSRQANNINLVTQAVLDASLRQTTVQLQTQITNEIKSIRDLLEQRTELAPAIIQQIKDIASKSGSDAGAETAEKTASSAAEAVAAKVSAAQAQIQVQQDVAPFIKQAQKAKLVSIIAVLAAGAAVAVSILI